MDRIARRTSARQHNALAVRRGRGASVQRRRALLVDLATIACSLSDHELNVLVTIAARVRVGQSRYGCLRLAHDSRDFCREALEEACDGHFYLAAGHLRASEGTRRLPGRARVAEQGHLDLDALRAGGRGHLETRRTCIAFARRSPGTPLTLTTSTTTAASRTA